MMFFLTNLLGGMVIGFLLILATVLAMIGMGGLIFTTASIYHYFADIVKEKLHERRTSRG